MKLRNKPSTIQNLFGITNLDETDAIRRRLSEGIDIDLQDSGGRTLLMQAAIERRLELATLLVKRGADVNMKDERNWTALHFSAQAFDLECVELLVENGADVNPKDDFGNNPIARAIFNSKGRGEVIEYLRRRGANIHSKNNAGVSALDLAERISNFDVKQFLVGHD